jgi:hypothetical protein
MKKPTVLIGVLALMGCASLANADIPIEISYQFSGGSQTVCGSGAVQPFSCTVKSGSGATAVTVFNSATTPDVGTDLVDQFDTLTITTKASAPHTVLTIWISAFDFTNLTAPTTPPLLYGSGLTVNSTKGTGTIGLVSCIDTANGVIPPAGTFCSNQAANLTNSNETYSGTGSNTYQNSLSTVIGGLITSPYSLDQQITLDLQPGSSLTVTTSQTLTPLPEPASVTLLGAETLGLFAFLALRCNKVASRS